MSARPGCPCPCCGQMVPRVSGFVPADAWRRRALDAISGDLGHHRGDGWRFLEAVFCECDRGARYGRLARDLAIQASTLSSRFLRAGLPSPGLYLRSARLVAACYRLDDPRVTVRDVAYDLRFNAPQAFGRSIRDMLGITASAMRARYSGDAMLARFRDTLVIPYAATLRSEPFLATCDVRLSRARRAEAVA